MVVAKGQCQPQGRLCLGARTMLWGLSFRRCSRGSLEMSQQRKNSFFFFFSDSSHQKKSLRDVSGPSTQYLELPVHRVPDHRDWQSPISQTLPPKKTSLHIWEAASFQRAITIPCRVGLAPPYFFFFLLGIFFPPFPSHPCQEKPLTSAPRL